MSPSNSDFHSYEIAYNTKSVTSKREFQVKHIKQFYRLKSVAK
jgi:hypothetical protein